MSKFGFEFVNRNFQSWLTCFFIIIRSLYPSCIQAYNLSVDTFIVDWESQKDLFTKDEIETIDCGNGKVYQFLKRDVLHGIVPKFLTGLLDERVRVKRLMKVEQDKMRKLILDCRQLSVKIIANSAYGLDHLYFVYLLSFFFNLFDLRGDQRILR